MISDVVIAGLRDEALQATLHALDAYRFFTRLIGRHRENAAPDAGAAVALDLEQIEPFVRIGEIIARTVAALGRLEVECRADLDEALGPGETLELDAGGLAHKTPGTIRSDHV